MIAEVINDWMTYMSREEMEQRLKEFFLEDFDKWSDEEIEEIWEETQRGSSQH
jgi:DNA topoisomerase VI subunit B